MRRALLFLISLPMLALAACPKDDPPDDAVVCLEAGSLGTCTPAYEPTYDNLYANTFQPTCAKSGFSCHSPEGHQGGLNFFDKEAVYEQLLNRPVKAGSPECSDLVQRVTSLDAFQRMPPGKSIPPGEQCAIIEWVRAGAKR
jgi:hypothetical protein